jgi:hypothetical protein
MHPNDGAKCRPCVKYDDLEMAFMFVSDTVYFDEAAYVCRKTGKVYWVSEQLGDELEAPDDVTDSELYAEVPNKFDLDLGTRLAFRFTERFIPQHHDEVSRIFHRKGAYSRYKDLLQSLGRLNEWYVFEESETESALRRWAEKEGFTVEGPGAPDA